MVIGIKVKTIRCNGAILTAGRSKKADQGKTLNICALSNTCRDKSLLTKGGKNTAAIIERSSG